MAPSLLDDPEYPGRDRTRSGTDPLDPEFLRARAETVPGDWARWFRLGYRYLELCEPRLAIVPLQRAIDLAPRNGLAHYLLGKALVGADRREEAEPVLQAATRLRSDLTEAWSLLAALRSGSERFSEALPAWKQVAQRAPSGEVYWQIGRCLIALERFNEATVVLEESVKLKPNHLLSHRALAYLGKIRKEPDVMLRHLRELFRLNEDMARDLDDKLRP